MQFERLRKNHKRKIIIGGLILVCVISAITITTTRAKYKLTEDIPLVRGNINYKSYDFKIMAMYKSEDGTNYTEINDRMPSTGYIINEERSYCTIDNKTHDTKAKLYTYNGKHIFENLAKSDKCYLYFDKKSSSASEMVLENITVKTDTPNFINSATTEEGVFKAEDGMYGGTSYYWRGAVTNNYVKFADKCWRIVRINGDKSIRLIYDGTTCHANGTSTLDNIAKTDLAYNANCNESYYVGWTYTMEQRPSTNVPQTSGTSSNAKTELEKWYSDNLTSYVENIEDGKYCNDRNVGAKYSGWVGTWATTWSAKGTQFAYAGIDRLWNKYQPTLSCSNRDIYSLKIGLITADEVEFAGGKSATNNAYYLYNGQKYWTMTPSYLSYGSSWSGACGGSGVFYVNANGSLSADRVDAFSCIYDVYSAYETSASANTGYGLRPVINLKSSVTFNGGDGTLNNPYVVA